MRKKLEIDFALAKPTHHMRHIPRAAIDRILSLAKCTVISQTSNEYFDAYVLSESSLFVYPTKVLLKTCGTTLLLRCLSELLAEARKVGAQPDFLQFSRSNFLFPTKQLYPHRAFGEETEYLGKVLGPLMPHGAAGHKAASAYILGPINGPRWHLYTVDWNRIAPLEYTQQVLEIIMFNLDPERMKTFYKRSEGDDGEKRGIGFPTSTGEEATTVSGIDKLLPGSIIDSNLFSPCGYSCNGLNEQAYFTVHITPEPECSFVSFETNASMQDYTDLVKRVIDTFKPGSWTMSLFVDEQSSIPDSRAGLCWNFVDYQNTGITHHAFPGSYNATCAQFASITPTPVLPIYGSKALNTPILSPSLSAYTANLYGVNGQIDHEAPSDVPHLSLNSYSYQTISTLSLSQKRALAIDSAKGRFSIESILPGQHILDSRAAQRADASDVVDESEDSSALIRSSAEQIIKQHLPDQAFGIIDLSSLVRRFHTWSSTFGRVEPVYQITRSLDNGSLSTLSALGCSFSCTSIAQANVLLRLGVSATRIALIHPYQSLEAIRFARDKGIELFAFHTKAELVKLTTHHPGVKLLLHLAVSDDPELSPIGTTLEHVPSLVEAAKQAQADIAGVRLNLPLYASVDVIRRSVIMARQAIDIITAAGLCAVVLDLGSGLPAGSQHESAALLLPILDEIVPNIRILGNAAPHFDSHLHALIGNILSKQTAVYHVGAKRKHANDNIDAMQRTVYYVAEGIMQENDPPSVVLPLRKFSKDVPSCKASVFELTAAGARPVVESIMLPELNVGDWLYLEDVRPIVKSKLHDTPVVHYVMS